MIDALSELPREMHVFRPENVLSLGSENARRKFYIDNNPDKEVDIFVYDNYKSFNEPWEIHFRKHIQHLDVSELVQLHEFTVSLASKDLSYGRERLVIATEICDKVAALNTPNCGVVYPNTENRDRSYLLYIDKHLGNVLIPLFSDDDEYKRRVDSPKINRFPDELEKGKQNFARLKREAIYQAKTPDQRFDAKYSELPLLNIEKIFNLDEIRDIVASYEHAEAEKIEYGYERIEYPILREVIRTSLVSGREIGQLLEKCNTDEIRLIQAEIGNLIGKMARRSVEPPNGELLYIVKCIARNAVVSEAIDSVVKVESRFWGKEFDPIDDAIVVDFVVHPRSESKKFLSIKEELEWAKFLSTMSLDMTRCSDNPQDYGSFSVPQSGEEVHLTGPGIYFGVLGGFRDWGKNRSIIHNMPVGLFSYDWYVNNLIGGGYISIPSWKLHVPKEALMDASTCEADFLVDGSKIVHEAWDPTKFSYSSQERAPIFKTIIIPEVQDLFRDIFPGAKMETRDVYIGDKMIPLPFMILPEGSSPMLYGVLMKRFQLPNVICEFGTNKR